VTRRGEGEEEGRGEGWGGKEEERGREDGKRGGEALAVEPSHFSTASDATGSDPRPVFEARRLFEARLLFEEIRYAVSSQQFASVFGYLAAKFQHYCRDYQKFKVPAVGTLILALCSTGCLDAIHDVKELYYNL